MKAVSQRLYHEGCIAKVYCKGCIMKGVSRRLYHKGCITKVVL